MASACPAPGPEDPLVQSLLLTVDCNVQALVYGGYNTLFQPSSPFAALLTTLLTIFVALFGYQLLLGRAQLRVGDLALTLVKLGVVLALTTQWSTYQAVVYAFLFDGPTQLANLMLNRVQPDESAFRGDVFGGLQVAFDLLTAYAGEYAKAAPPNASPLLGGPGFGAVGLTASASMLLLASLGVLLAAKIVLGVLLAVGPVFIALLLFESTRGLFEGWLRATLAFAFAPLAAILLLGVVLTMLEPSLGQLSALVAARQFLLGPVYSTLLLVLVFGGVSLGLMIAGGVIAGGLKLPGRRPAPAAPEGRADAARSDDALLAQPRAARVAAAAAAMDRRETMTLTGAGPTFAAAPAGGSGDRRTEVSVTGGGGRGPADRLGGSGEARLGQATRRSSRPRTARGSGRRV